MTRTTMSRMENSHDMNSQDEFTCMEWDIPINIKYGKF
jgi:hypothetical protein